MADSYLDVLMRLVGPEAPVLPTIAQPPGGGSLLGTIAQGGGSSNVLGTIAEPPGRGLGSLFGTIAEPASLAQGIGNIVGAWARDAQMTPAQREAKQIEKEKGKGSGTIASPSTRPGAVGAVSTAVPEAYRATVQEAANATQVNPALLAAVLKQESQFNPNATNATSGAQGIAQFMPATARAVGLQNPYDPAQAIPAAARYLADILQRNGGNETLALVEYNGGPRAVQAWNSGQPFGESQAYVRGVQGHQATFAAPAAWAQGTGTPAAARVFPVQGYTGAVSTHHGSVRGGSDIMAPAGTPVMAMEGGRVVSARWDDTGGWTVFLRGDDGLQYYYAHLQSAPLVQTGAQVQRGQPLGAVGNTGNAQSTPPHLHIGIGPQIVNGVGPTGGTGGDFDAVGLLQQALGGR